MTGARSAPRSAARPLGSRRRPGAPPPPPRPAAAQRAPLRRRACGDATRLRGEGGTRRGRASVAATVNAPRRAGMNAKRRGCLERAGCLRGRTAARTPGGLKRLALLACWAVKVDEPDARRLPARGLRVVLEVPWGGDTRNARSQSDRVRLRVRAQLYKAKEFRTQKSRCSASERRCNRMRDHAIGELHHCRAC